MLQLFTDKNINPCDILGIGTNMVKSLRYWMTAVGIMEEVSEGNQKVQKLTRLGEIIDEYDKYYEISKEGKVAVLHILGMIIWNTNDTAKIIIEHIGIEIIKQILEVDLYDIIKDEINNIQNNPDKYKSQRNMRNHPYKNILLSLFRLYCLLFGMLLYRDKYYLKYEYLHNLLDPASEISGKYIEQLDEIWKYIVSDDFNKFEKVYQDKNDIIRNSFIKFEIKNMPKEMDKKVPEIFFAVRSYLTGNFNGSTITIKEFNNKSESL